MPLKHIRHSEKIDLGPWIADSDLGGWQEIFMRGVLAYATELLRESFDKDTPEPYFPHSYAFGSQPEHEDGIGGELPDDPLTIYIALPLGPNLDELPYFSITITKCVDDLIDGARGGDGKIEAHHAGVIAIRDALRAQAQQIDDALAEPNGEQNCQNIDTPD